MVAYIYKDIEYIGITWHLTLIQINHLNPFLKEWENRLPL